MIELFLKLCGIIFYFVEKSICLHHNQLKQKKLWQHVQELVSKTKMVQ